MNHYQGSLGKDWNHNYEVSLTFQKSRVFPEEEITILLEDGKEELFLPVDGTTYTPGNQSLASLEKTEEGYEYRRLSGERYLFDAGGRYLRQEDANGEGFSLQYGAEGKLLCIQKDTGENNIRRDTIELREFLIEDENHQRIRVHVYTDKVNMGDYMKINYLPHTHMGTVVERSKQE